MIMLFFGSQGAFYEPGALERGLLTFQAFIYCAGAKLFFQKYSQLGLLCSQGLGKQQRKQQNFFGKFINTDLGLHKDSSNHIFSLVA